MTMNRRDKMLLLVLPAIAIFLGYATYGLSQWRTKFTAAEKSITAIRERIPSHDEEHRRQDRLTAATRGAKFENEAIALVNLEIATGTKSIASEKAEFAELRTRIAGPTHREELAKLRTEQLDAIKRMDAEHRLARTEAEAKHAAALASLWVVANGPSADRTERIELLDKVLARFNLTVTDATDDVRGESAPPRLAMLMKASTEAKGLAPPKPRQIRVLGRYSEVAAALESVSRGDAWAIPLGLAMKPATDDSGKLEWTLTVWV